MENTEMLDKLFGSPAPQTLMGKYEKNKCFIIMMTCLVGAAAIIMWVSKNKNLPSQPKEKEED